MTTYGRDQFDLLPDPKEGRLHRMEANLMTNSPFKGGLQSDIDKDPLREEILRLRGLLEEVVKMGFKTDQDEWTQSQKACFYCGAEEPMKDGEPWPHEENCLWLKIESTT